MRLTSPCNPQCCGDSCKVNSNHCCCFLPDIQREQCKLQKRHKRLITKRKRTQELALPKRRSEKFQAKCISQNDLVIRRIQMVYLEQGDCPKTRTEQLAFPPASRLLELKNCSPSYEGFCQSRKMLVNRMIRSSLMSLYSRLSNTQPPEKPAPKKKFSVAEWDKHKKHMKVLSKPKRDMAAKPPPRKSKSASELRRYKKLAKPKVYEDTVAKEWHLTTSLKTYVPSKRILQMSKTKPVQIFDADEPYRVKKEALRYKATSRIKELATPSYHSNKMAELRENPFRTPRGALKAKASPRILQLAEPKDFMDTHIRPNPYKVSPRALKARMTPRLLELSKPKVYAT